jgi:hypothetical protein
MMACTRISLTAMLAVLASLATAQSGGQFAVDKAVIAGGSADAAGGTFHVAATVGQHDAGAMSGGSFSVQGGYWAGCATSASDTIFRSGFEAAKSC